MSTARGPSMQASAGAFVLVLLGTFLSAHWSYRLQIGPQQITPIWPPVGIALGAMLVTAGRMRAACFWGLVVALIAFDLLKGRSVASVAVFAAAGALELMFIVRMTRHWFGTEIRFERLAELWGTLGIATMGVCVSGAVLALGLQQSGFAPAGASLWQSWVLSHLVGYTTFTAVVIAAGSLRWPVRRWRVADSEPAVALIVLAGVATFVLDRLPAASRPTDLAPLAVLFPIYLWIGVRCGPRIGALAACIVAVLTVEGITAGLGPFSAAQASAVDRTLAAQAFMVTSSLSILSLAILTGQRLRSERALRASERRFHAVYEQAFGFMGLLKPDGSVVDVNRRALDFVGRQLHEVVGRPLWDTPWFKGAAEDVRAQLKAAVVQASQGRPAHFVGVFGHKDGQPVTVHASESPIFDEQGRVVLVLSEGRDISEIQRANQRLADSEQRLRTLVAMSSDWYWEQDADFRFVDMSDGAHLRAGVPAVQLLGKTRWDLAKAPALAALWARHRQVLERHEPYRDFEYPGVDQAGRPITLSVSGDPVFDGQGRFTGYRGIGRNVTEQRRAAQRLADSEQRFRALVAMSSDWYWEQDDQFRFVEMSAGQMLAAGSDPASFMGKTRWDIKAILLDESQWAAHRALLERHEPFRNVEYQRLSDGGDVVWISINGEPIFDLNGRFKGYRGTGTNITDRKRAEQLLARRNEDLEAAVATRTQQLQSMLDAALSGILTIDANGAIQTVNAATTRLLGYTRNELVGQNISVLMPHPHQSEHDGYLAAYRASGQKKIIGIGREVQARHKSGALVPIHLSVSEYSSQGERFFTGIMTDLTERIAAEQALRERERQLAQAQKMEVVGQLSGGIAHDFNNLLTVVIGNQELLETAVHGDEDQDILRRATAAARAAARLTRRLLTVARRQRLEPTTIDLNEQVAGMLELLRHSLGETIRIELELAPDLWPISADASEVENAVLNLVLNARDACTGEGLVVIDTANVTLTEGDVGHDFSLRPGDYVRLSVTDTGHGMSPEVRARVFEPFFTTKEPGKGTGLGLATLYGFAKQSAGHVSIFSQPGRGTTVNLFLPRLATPGPAAVAPRSVEPVMGHGESILVVEDNADVRLLATRRLWQLGYKTREADSAAHAISVLSGNDAVDLVFSDVVMPGGMSGFDLAQWVHEHCPGLPVLLTSGYARMAEGASSSSGEATPLLRKPYTAVELSLALSQAFRRRG